MSIGGNPPANIPPGDYPVSQCIIQCALRNELNSDRSSSEGKGDERGPDICSLNRMSQSQRAGAALLKTNKAITAEMAWVFRHQWNQYVEFHQESNRALNETIKIADRMDDLNELFGCPEGHLPDYGEDFLDVPSDLSQVDFSDISGCPEYDLYDASTDPEQLNSDFVLSEFWSDVLRFIKENPAEFEEYRSKKIKLVQVYNDQTQVFENARRRSQELEWIVRVPCEPCTTGIYETLAEACRAITKQILPAGNLEPPYPTDLVIARLSEKSTEEEVDSAFEVLNSIYTDLTSRLREQRKQFFSRRLAQDNELTGLRPSAPL